MLPAAAAAGRGRAASHVVRGSYLPRYNQRAEAFEHRFPSSSVNRVNPVVLRRTLADAARAEVPPPGTLSDTMRWYGERKDLSGALHVFESAAKSSTKLSVEDWGTFLRVCDGLFPSKIRFYNYGMKKFLEEEKNPKKVLEFAAIMQAAGDKPDDMTKELVQRAKTMLGIAAADDASPAAANKPEQKT